MRLAIFATLVALQVLVSFALLTSVPERGLTTKPIGEHFVCVVGVIAPDTYL